MEKDIYKMWNEVLKNLENRLNNPRTFDLWIKPVKIVDLNENIVKIEIPNLSFEKNFLPFIGMIKEEFYKIFGIMPEFEIIYPTETKDEEIIFYELSLNPEYTFENFVVGP
ncbi:MAG: DnaA N-terminal domain-containing protein, partial [Candidatus Ratteibacteria bacterium]